MKDSRSPTLDAMQRAWTYWFADGLTNLVLGISMLLMAFCLIYPPPPHPGPLLLWAIALTLSCAITARHKQIVEWLKARTTYPRTGYVQSLADDPLIEASRSKLYLQETATPPDEAERIRASRMRTVYIMLGLVILASFGMLLIHQRWMWTAEGIVIGIAMIFASKQFRVSWIVPIGFPLLGLYMTLFVTPSVRVPGIFLAGWGVIFVLDGAIAFLRYVLRNPLPQEPTA